MEEITYSDGYKTFRVTYQAIPGGFAIIAVYAKLYDTNGYLVEADVREILSVPEFVPGTEVYEPLSYYLDAPNRKYNG